MLAVGCAAAIQPLLADDHVDYRSYEGTLTLREQRLFADVSQGSWRKQSLLTAALVASGVDESERFVRYEARMAEMVAELRRSLAGIADHRVRAEEILRYLHRRLLTGGYRLDSTDISLAFDVGRFNCVSASVLFNCVARECGLVVRGIEAPGHAMSQLILPEGTIEIETTCPDGFRLASNPRKSSAEPAKALGNGTVGTMRSAGHEKDSTGLRVVSDAELVATIYYNRGVELLGQKHFSAALAANAKSLRLDPANAAARGNLLAALNNWAVAEAAEGRCAAAAALLRKGLAIDPAYAILLANYRHVYRRWVDDLCRNERFKDALELLSESARGEPEASFVEEARKSVHRRWDQSKRNAEQSGSP